MVFVASRIMLRMHSAVSKDRLMIEAVPAFRYGPIGRDPEEQQLPMIVQISRHTTINTRVFRSTHYPPPLSSSPSASLSRRLHSSGPSRAITR